MADRPCWAWVAIWLSEQRDRKTGPAATGFGLLSDPASQQTTGGATYFRYKGCDYVQLSRMLWTVVWPSLMIGRVLLRKQPLAVTCSA